MQDLLKQYHDAKFAKYSSRMPEREASIAAQFALQDMLVNVKRNMAIYSEEDVAEIIRQEIEDAQ